ncbi:MAG: hypothetical protein QXL17_02110 [Candidatus Thermoplasmatota archaeon]
MKKKLLSILIFVIILSVFLAGCQEEPSGVKTFKGVRLVSNVVELKNASLDTVKNRFDEIMRVEVRYLFHNIAGRDIRVKVNASFYDRDNTLIATVGPKNIYLLENYTERAVTPANTISYEGPGVERIDHVVLTVN